jgi:hypothetical protein
MFLGDSSQDLNITDELFIIVYENIIKERKILKVPRKK